MAQDMARHPGYAHLKKLSVMLDFLVTAVFIACVGAYALEWNTFQRIKW